MSPYMATHEIKWRVLRQRLSSVICMGPRYNYVPFWKGRREILDAKERWDDRSRDLKLLAAGIEDGRRGHVSKNDVLKKSTSGFTARASEVQPAHCFTLALWNWLQSSILLNCKINFCRLSHWTCGHLLQQQKGVNVLTEYLLET